jgi:4-carboxymuconolactone decarboxylase
MKFLAMTLASLSLFASSMAMADPTKARSDVQSVAPALDQYRQETLFGNLWKRPGLGVRDRSIATVAALIARNQTAELPEYLNLALDNGVKPSEISEIVTHLAFYSGWGNAMAAVPVVKDVFATRKIATDQLSPAMPRLLALMRPARRIGQSVSGIYMAQCFRA